MIFLGKVRYHHRHYDNEESHHGINSFNDYNEAVNEYKKSFPSKADVMKNTPDAAVREMLGHMEKVGCETCFDRFDSQKPHCNFGIAGVCCRNCNIGPCRITKKAPGEFVEQMLI